MRWVAAVLVLVAACETPPLKIIYRIAEDGAQSCGTSECTDVKLACDTVLNIRILSPDDPDAPYLSICEPVQLTSDGDLCSIARVNVEPVELPKQRLEIQVLLWSRDAVIDPATGEVNCRLHDVEFDATRGFPLSRAPAPALGGRAFYYPGDAETVVTLGCTDLLSVTGEMCTGEPEIEVRATVTEFESRQPTVIANQLNLAVGEPTERQIGPDIVHELRPANTRRLELRVPPPIAVWGASVDITFNKTACIEVLEDAPQSTTSVVCTEDFDEMSTQLDLSGIHFDKVMLDQIIDTLGLDAFPQRGLTVGIVLDDLDTAAANHAVSVVDGSGTVEYLSADLTAVGGTRTTASGMFVSRDAPYGTKFVASSAAQQSQQEIGGLIFGKLTLVVLRPPAVGQ